MENTDSVEFYMLEYLLEDLEEKIDKENKRFKQQEADYQKQTQFNNPKLPKVGSTDYGGFKTPKMNVPKWKAPSMPTGKF